MGLAGLRNRKKAEAGRLIGRGEQAGVLHPADRFPFFSCLIPWLSAQAPNNCRNAAAHIAILLGTSMALRLFGENENSFKWLARLSTSESHSSLLCHYRAPTRACRPLHTWPLSMDVPHAVPCFTCTRIISAHPFWLWPEDSFLCEEEDFLGDASRSLLVHHVFPPAGAGTVAAMFILSVSVTPRLNPGMPERPPSEYVKWNKASKAIRGKVPLHVINVERPRVRSFVRTKERIPDSKKKFDSGHMKSLSLGG